MPSTSEKVETCNQLGAPTRAEAGPQHDSLSRACDPSTPSAVLAKLARSRDRLVRQTVAANPNASRKELMSLALTFPDTVSQNSVLDWWLLEDPNWLADVDSRSRHRLLGSAALPPGTRWWAARFGDDDDHSAILRNALTEPAIAEFLRANNDEEIVSLANDHVSLQSGTDATLPRVSELEIGELNPDSDELQDLLALAKPSYWAIAALDVSSFDVRRSLAAHASLPRKMLLRLLLDDEPRIVEAAMNHPLVDDNIRFLVERVRTSDPDLTATELAEVRDSPVGLRCAAAHPNLPAAIRSEFATHLQWTVRQAAAASLLLPINLLERLAFDADRDVRAAAAANPTLKQCLVWALRCDRDEMVRNAAINNSRAERPSPPETLTIEEIQTRLADGREAAVAGYDLLPRSIQHRLASHENWRLRLVLASNRTVAPSVLNLLATDVDIDVRRAVVTNDRCSSATLAILAVDSAPEIRALVADGTGSRNLLEILAIDADAEVRRRVVTSRFAPLSVRRALAVDIDASVRLELAKREGKLPIDILIRLASDESDEVRAAVVARPSLAPSVLTLAVSLRPTGGDEVPVDQTAQHSTTLRRLKANAPVDHRFVTELLAAFAWLGSFIVRLPGISTDTQATLATSLDWTVREALANRSDIDSTVLATLAQDSDFDTRAAVARNLLTPSVVLDTLATDAHRAVRIQVASREALSVRVVRLLQVDEDAEIRAQLTLRVHVETPVEALISDLISRRPIDPTRLYELMDFPYIRRLAAAHPSTLQAQLETLATDTKWEVREIVAGNPNATSAILEALSLDTDRDVRRAAAGNLKTPATVLDILSVDADRSVSRVALTSLNQDEGRREVARRQVVNCALRSPNLASRIFALSCNDVDAAELSRRRHSMNIDWRIRMAVAVHPATPPEVRSRLALDGLLRVRMAARSGNRQLS